MRVRVLIEFMESKFKMEFGVLFGFLGIDLWLPRNIPGGASPQSQLQLQIRALHLAPLEEQEYFAASRAFHLVWIALVVAALHTASSVVAFAELALDKSGNI
jgi:hypothetical protein